MGRSNRRSAVILAIGAMALSLSACGGRKAQDENLLRDNKCEEKMVVLFAPMERSRPDAENIARTAFDQTIIMAEKKLNLKVEYNTYTSENYQEKTYDDVSLDRIRNNMDDFYLLNPDVLQKKIGRAHV